MLSEADPSLPHRVVRRVVTKYDGNTICLAPDGAPAFEIGTYLGGGSAGVVYEAVACDSHDRFAVKIINPTGFRLLSAVMLKQFVVAVRGAPMDEDTTSGRKPVSAHRISRD